VQQPLGVKVFHLKHADARKTADVLTAILGGRGGLRLTVDDRTNSVVLAADAETTELARKLIARLDTPLPPAK
jgi:type II secretory pathway component GspD/PulD (secretin)